MNTLNPTQVQRFRKLFPELDEDLAVVVLLYATGATQSEVAEILGLSSRRPIERMLKEVAKQMALSSVPTIRVVVQNRIYFALLDFLAR